MFKLILINITVCVNLSCINFFWRILQISVLTLRLWPFLKWKYNSTWLKKNPTFSMLIIGHPKMFTSPMKSNSQMFKYQAKSASLLRTKQWSHLHFKYLVPFRVQSRLYSLRLLLVLLCVVIRNEFHFNIGVGQSIWVHGTEVFCLLHCNLQIK